MDHEEGQRLHDDFVNAFMEDARRMAEEVRAFNRKNGAIETTCTEVKGELTSGH